MNDAARERAIELILGGMNVQLALGLAAVFGGFSGFDPGVMRFIAPTRPIGKMPRAECVQAYLAGKQPISRADVEEAFRRCGAD